MLENLTLETFTPLIGQKFRVTLPDSDIIEMELVDVEELPTGSRRRRHTSTPMRTPFSLFFKGASRLPQAMYPIGHEALGDEPLPIFIVPVAAVEGGFEYEAVFT